MEKILTFILKEDKILLLLGDKTDPQFHKSFWYTVTGACEKSEENKTDTVIREVKEETNLNLYKIIDLNWIFEYESLGKQCIEHAFISYTNEDNIILNDKSIDYKWCNLKEFIDLIKWHYDKKELYNKLKEYVDVNYE